SDVVQCLITGKDGVIWACTENGLARMDFRKGSERIQAFHAAQGLSSENVHAACEDSAGKLWTGGDGPLLSVWDGTTFTPRPLQGLPAAASVRALVCAGDT